VYWTTDEQREAYERTRAVFAKSLADAGYGGITTEAKPAEEAGEFYYAEEYHQQYLSDSKNPYGYCPSHSTGVSCPVGLGVTSSES
jgi:peptide-methionine (S)-S-oxide reductase